MHFFLNTFKICTLFIYAYEFVGLEHCLRYLQISTIVHLYGDTSLEFSGKLCLSSFTEMHLWIFLEFVFLFYGDASPKFALIFILFSIMYYMNNG